MGQPESNERDCVGRAFVVLFALHKSISNSGYRGGGSLFDAHKEASMKKRKRLLIKKARLTGELDEMKRIQSNCTSIHSYDISIMAKLAGRIAALDARLTLEAK